MKKYIVLFLFVAVQVLALDDKGAYEYGGGQSKGAYEDAAPSCATTITHGTGGTTNIASDNSACGTAVAIVATPSAHYTFVNWTRSGSVTVADSTVASTTFSAFGTGATVTANFSAIVYDTLFTKAGTGGTISPSSRADSSNNASHANFTFQANPSEGKIFNPPWTSTNGFITYSPTAYANPVTITSVSANDTLIAAFSTITYDTLWVISNNPAAGSVSPSRVSDSGTNLNHNLSVSATANAGYGFYQWIRKQGHTSFANSLNASTTATISANDTAVAVFIAIPVISYTGGNVTDSRAITVAIDSTISTMSLVNTGGDSLDSIRFHPATFHGLTLTTATGAITGTASTPTAGNNAEYDTVIAYNRAGKDTAIATIQILSQGSVYTADSITVDTTIMNLHVTCDSLGSVYPTDITDSSSHSFSTIATPGNYDTLRYWSTALHKVRSWSPDSLHDTISVRLNDCDTIKANFGRVSPVLPVLSSPNNGDSSYNAHTIFTWGYSKWDSVYYVQIDSSSSFNSSLMTIDTVFNSNISKTLHGNITYYWRVRAENPNGITSYSTARHYKIFKKRGYVDKLKSLGYVHLYCMNGNGHDTISGFNANQIGGTFPSSDASAERRPYFVSNTDFTAGLGFNTSMYGANNCNKMTISFAVKISDTSNTYPCIFATGQDLSTDYLLLMYYPNTHALDLQYKRSGTVFGESFITWAHDMKKHFVSVVYDGTISAAYRVRFYVDGVDQSVNNIQTFPSNINQFTGDDQFTFIGGAYSNGSTFNLIGWVDEFGVSTSALSSTDIYNVYMSSMNPVTILVTGQSNSLQSLTYPKTMSDTAIYKLTPDFSGIYSSTLKIGHYSTDFGSNYSSGLYSFGPSLGAYLVNYYSRPVLFISTGWGGQGMHNAMPTTQPWAYRNESFHADTTTIYGRALAMAEYWGDSIDCLIYQGSEADMRIPDLTGDSLKTDFHNFVLHWRDDNIGCPIYVGIPGRSLETADGYPAIDSVADTVRKVICVLADSGLFNIGANAMCYSLMDGIVHWSLGAADICGLQYGHAITENKTNIFPKLTWHVETNAIQAMPHYGADFISLNYNSPFYGFNGSWGQISGATKSTDTIRFSGSFSIMTYMRGANFDTTNAIYDTTSSLRLSAQPYIFSNTSTMFTMTNANDGNGTFTPASGYQDSGISFSIIASPKSGYTFLKWTRSDTNVIIADSGASRTTAYLKADGTITANFVVGTSSGLLWGLVIGLSFALGAGGYGAYRKLKK